MTGREVLDLFSAAAGGWSLGMHRAGFETIAACEAVAWRRELYAVNNPNVRLYDDVCTLTAKRLRDDLGRLPAYVVGSPPCQDISSANTKGKGVDGERSGLYFEAVRIIGECRPRWFALENSANLRTRGADRVKAALEAIGYTCWFFVVGADDAGANHKRKRSWLIGCDIEQVADPDALGRDDRWSRWRSGIDLSVSNDHLDAAGIGHEGGRAWGYRPDGNGASYAGDPTQDGCGSGLPGRRGGPTGWSEQPTCGDAADASIVGRVARPGDDEGSRRKADGHESADSPASGRAERNTPDHPSACPAWSGRSADGSGERQMGVCAPDRDSADGSRPLWSLANLAGRLRLDDGLPARVAGTRVAVGGPKGTAAASLIVEAYGDAVIPQIPEAIGRAILRTEAALASIYGLAA